MDIENDSPELTWEGMLPSLLNAIEKGRNGTRSRAYFELLRMARIADRYRTNYKNRSTVVSCIEKLLNVVDPEFKKRNGDKIEEIKKLIIQFKLDEHG